MIQEILDYLLIRAHFFICTDEELLEKVKDEHMLEIYCDNICRILEQEAFFFTSDEIMQKLQNFVSAKRFDGKHKNEIIIDFNIMVDAINQYKNLSDSDKMIITAKWIDEEAQARELPFRRFPGYTLDIIYQHIKNDSYYAKILLQDNNVLEIYDPFYMLTTINFLCNRYPDTLLENINAIVRCEASVFMFEDIYKKSFLSRKMIKKTYKLLDNVVGRIPDEGIKNFQKTIKKTDF